jgi:hypothetical protein
VGGQRHAPAALPPGKTRYPLYRELGGPQGWSGRVRKILLLTGIRSPDRPAHSESLYRLSYPGPQEQTLGLVKICVREHVEHSALPRAALSTDCRCKANRKFGSRVYRTAEGRRKSLRVPAVTRTWCSVFRVLCVN